MTASVSPRYRGYLRNRIAELTPRCWKKLRAQQHERAAA